jgi:hypothetical protein
LQRALPAAGKSVQPLLVGSVWSAVKAMRRAQDHMKSDERILGDGEFAQLVLDEAKERLEKRYRHKNN